MQQQGELISVIVPVYNAGMYLETCVRSLLRQDYPSFEILLVDDGSTDDSLALARRFAEEDPRVRCIHTENGGVSRARNTGLDNMRGVYFAFVDADDFVTPDFLSILYRCIQISGCAISQVQFTSIVRSDFSFPGTCLPFQKKRVRICPVSSFLHIYGFDDQGGKLINKLYRTERFRSLRFPLGQRYGEDSRFSCSALLACDNVATYDQLCYYYLLTPASATTGVYTLDRLQELDNFEDLIPKVIARHDAALTRSFYEEYRRTLAFHIKRVRGLCVGNAELLERLMLKNKEIASILKEMTPLLSLARLSLLCYAAFPCTAVRFYFKWKFLQKIFFKRAT